MQFQADVLGVPVERPDMVETTALGAAGLAGLALGVWKGSDEFLAGRRFDRFDPTLGGPSGGRCGRRGSGPSGRRSRGRALRGPRPECVAELTDRAALIARTQRPTAKGLLTLEC